MNQLQLFDHSYKAQSTILIDLTPETLQSQEILFPFELK